MIRTAARIIAYFVVLALFQGLVMNNINIFGLMTPFVYIYVVIKMPVDMNRIIDVVVAFLLGLTIDMFSNTYGIHAAATTLMGFVRRPLSERFLDLRDVPDGSIPSYNLFGYARFMRYTFILASLHTVTLFLVEAFSFDLPLWTLYRTVSSILLTCLLIFTIEAFNLPTKKNG